MIATVPSATLLGVDGHPVSVEVHVANGLPTFTIVGLPDAACREARDRVRAAFVSSGIRFPSKRVTVNLAPSDVRKVGSGLDVAIAIGLLVAAGDLPLEVVAGCAFVGELGLDGAVHAVPGIVALVDALQTDHAVVPLDSATQAALVGRLRVRGAQHLAELVRCLKGDVPWPDPPPSAPAHQPTAAPDLGDVRGQPMARWAIEVAAAGGHNLLMIGPPGAGKSMLAQRCAGLLPDLDPATAMVATRVHSAAGTLGRGEGLLRRPPFRAPHHTSSLVSITGGGSGTMRPGESSLSHGGILFVDEMGEFPRAVLDTLRQPLEEGVLRVARAKATVTYPARFQLIAAMNPCPCGEGTTPGACRCGEAQRARYMSRVSGPLLDRFDLRVVVPRPDPEVYLDRLPAETTAEVRQRVAAARTRATARGVACNAMLPSAQLDQFCRVGPTAERLLLDRLRDRRLTARGLDRVRRIALTLQDLAGEDAAELDARHVGAALELRGDVLLRSLVAA